MTYRGSELVSKRKKTMRAASIQMTVGEGDKARNLERAVEKIRQLKGVGLIVLPELWTIGFICFDRYFLRLRTRMVPPCGY